MIEKCDYGQIKHLRSIAAKDRVSINDAKNTTWYRYGSEGCCALVNLGRGSYRMKAFYVIPQSRGIGIGSEMFRFLQNRCAEMGAKKIEAFSHHSSIYKSNGYSGRPYKGDIMRWTKVLS